MGWARFGSSSLRLASLATRWSVVAVCAMALLLEGVSHWRMVGVWERTIDQFAEGEDLFLYWKTSWTVGDGRLEYDRHYLDLDARIEEWGRIYEPVGRRVPFRQTWHLEFSPTRTVIYGFFYERLGFVIRLTIPLYMIWLPTLPLAVWVIVRHVRWRKARRVKGFELIVPSTTN